MIKLALKLFILIVTVSICTNMVYAVEYDYKVYNPQKKVTYTAKLGTIGVTDKEYLQAFFTKEGMPLCILSNSKEQANGTIGGDCSEYNSFKKHFIEGNENVSVIPFTWTEITRNTYYKELVNIVTERAKQGKFMY